MRKISFVLLMAVAIAVFMSCDDGTQVPEKYKDFYNYPDGRKDPQGMLKITNNANSKALLFMDSVSPGNYIGTVEGNISSITVNLPNQKFYTIVAVDKKTWEDQGDQAERYSDITYFSKTQHFSMSVSPSSLGGGATWYIINRGNYWVTFVSQDGSGNILAAVPPRTPRMSVPVQYDKVYGYVPHYFKELKYKDVVYALSEVDDLAGADEVYIRKASGNTSFTTEVGVSISSPTSNLKPAVLITNHTGKTAQVFFGSQKELKPEGIDEFRLSDGDSFIFSGFEVSNNVNQINLLTSVGRNWVIQSMEMEKSKVYKIDITATSSTVNPEDAEDFYNDDD